jgi:hypothetical protein
MHRDFVKNAEHFEIHMGQKRPSLTFLPLYQNNTPNDQGSDKNTAFATAGRP